MPDTVTTREICRLSNLIRRRLNASATGGFLNGAEGKILHYILFSNQDPIYQKKIEEAFGWRASTTSQLLAKMEKDGLICRVADETDKRLKRICATEKGETFRGKVMMDATEIERALTAGLTPKQLQQFNRLLSRMIENLET